MAEETGTANTPEQNKAIFTNFVRALEDGLNPVLASRQPVIENSGQRYLVTSMQDGHFNAQPLGDKPEGGVGLTTELPCDEKYLKLVMQQIIPGWGVPLTRAAGAGGGGASVGTGSEHI